MKKILISGVLFLSVILFVSCAKQSSNPFQNLSELTKEVISKPTLQEMKQGQGLLSAQEREELWSVKLNYILNNETAQLSKEQRAIVLKIKNVLDHYGMKMLLKKPEIGIKFLDENLPYFSKYFNKEQLNILLESPYLNTRMNISTFTIRNMSVIAFSEEGGVCSCIYDLGCPGPNNTCDNTGCSPNSSVEQCGLFGTSTCKRRCTGSEPNMDI